MSYELNDTVSGERGETAIMEDDGANEDDIG